MIRLPRLLTVFAVMMALAEACYPQPEAAPGEAGLKLHATAKKIASPAGGPVELHWVPDPFPRPSDILVSNPVLAKELADTLNRLAEDDLCKGAWVLENSQTCTLGEMITRALMDFKFSFVDDVNLLFPPDEEGKQIDLTLLARYEISQKPLTVESIEAVISTGNAKKDPAAVELKMSVAEAARRIGSAGIPTNIAGDEVITVRLSDQDRKRPPSPEFPVDRLQDELFRVGLNVLKMAADRGLVYGKPASQINGQLTSIDDAIADVYRIEHPQWPAMVNTKYEGGKYTIEVTNLRFVALVDAKIVRGQIPGEKGPVDFRGATDAGEARLARILSEASERARRFMEENGSTLVGTIPTRAGVQAVFDSLQKLPDARAPFDVFEDGGAIVFQATYPWIDANIDAKLGLQAGYDPEQLFTGGGEVRAHNMIGTLFDREVLDDWELDAKGGPEVQRATLNLTIARSRGVANLFTYGTDFLMHISRDRNQRMGNLPAVRGQDDKDTRLVDQEGGLMPGLFLQHDRAGNWKNSIRMDASLDWRRVLVHPQLSALAALADGQLTAWDFGMEEKLWHDFAGGTKEASAGGISEVRLSLSGKMRRATRWLGGDFDFSRPLFSASGEAMFGWRTRRELLVRHTWGAGSASAGTPVFQLYRLGGSNNVRGLEEGEFVGRNLRFQQSTLGIALPVIFTALRDAEGPLAALANSYVTVFYDRGQVEIEHIRHFANGYGFAVEIRSLPAGNRYANVSIGWARSPQSFLHRRGVCTLGVNFDF